MTTAKTEVLIWVITQKLLFSGGDVAESRL